MHHLLYTQIQEEFDQFANSFKEKEQAVLADKELMTIQSKYNLQDIQPYFPQMTNKVISSDAKLLIESEEDFDPEKDDLYDYKINLHNKKARTNSLERTTLPPPLCPIV